MSNVRDPVSPDTTINTKATPSSSTSSFASKVTAMASSSANCDYCPSPAPVLDTNAEKTNHLSKHHDLALFGCGLCDDRFDAIDDIRGHVGNVHAISEDIIDKLVRLPFTIHLRMYRCVACTPNSRRYIGITEEQMRSHFKTKHKTNVIKPFLLKRICRVCGMYF